MPLVRNKQQATGCKKQVSDSGICGDDIAAGADEDGYYAAGMAVFVGADGFGCVQGAAEVKGAGFGCGGQCSSFAEQV